MEEQNLIEVIGENGDKFQAEVIEIFELEQYPGKEYILYSFGEQVDEENEKVYVSILNEKEDEYVLSYIEDEEEQRIVNKAIDELLELSDEEREALEESDDINE